MKITDKRTSDVVIRGDYAFELEPGTVVEIIKSHYTAEKEIGRILIGRILMRTSSHIHPFVNLEDGVLYGNELQNYVFKILEEYEFVLK
jgi:hypothetical protein